MTSIWMVVPHFIVMSVVLWFALMLPFAVYFELWPFGDSKWL